MSQHAGTLLKNKLISFFFAVFLIISPPAFGASESDFPIVELSYKDNTQSIHLLAEYGFIIDWPESGEPAFYIFIKQSRLRIKIEEWSMFLEELKKLPDSITIDEIGKCSVPFSWGMPKDKTEEFENTLKEKSIKIINQSDLENHVMFCYCESLGYKILYDELR